MFCSSKMFHSETEESDGSLKKKIKNQREDSKATSEIDLSRKNHKLMEEKKAYEKKSIEQRVNFLSSHFMCILIYKLLHAYCVLGFLLSIYLIVEDKLSSLSLFPSNCGMRYCKYLHGMFQKSIFLLCRKNI